jgi:hypothetical protein
MSETALTEHSWGPRGTVSAVAVAAAVAVLGGAAVYAATDAGHRGHPTTAPPHAFSASASSGFGAGPGGRDPRPEATLHGEFVVETGQGGYTTMLAQAGTVTSVSADTVTVRSADDYTQTYALDGAAAAAAHELAANDRVVVQARRTGPAVTVTTIRRR